MVTPSDQIQNHIGDPREFTFWGVRTRTVGVDIESSCTYFRQKSETSFHIHGAIFAQRICNLPPAARHIDCQLPFFPVAGHLWGAVRLSCGIFHKQSRAAGVIDVMVDGQVLVGVKGSTARHRPAKHQQPASHHPRIGLMALVIFGDLKNRSLRAMHIQILELVLFVFLFWLLFFFFCIFLFKFFCNKRGPCHVNFLSCLAPVTSPQRPCHSAVAGGAGEAACLIPICAVIPYIYQGLWGMVYLKGERDGIHTWWYVQASWYTMYQTNKRCITCIISKACPAANHQLSDFHGHPHKNRGNEPVSQVSIENKIDMKWWGDPLNI